MNHASIELTAHEKIVLDNMKREMGYFKQWCLMIPAEQNTAIYGGYIPSMVFRDVQTYFTLNGPLYSDMPFIIGQTLDEATQRCRLMNEYLGLDAETVREILESAGQAAD